MRKLISIILILVISGAFNLIAYADTSTAINDIAGFDIKPKNTKPVTVNSDIYYYGAVYTKEDFDRNNLNYTAVVQYDIVGVKINALKRGNCTVTGNGEYNLNVGSNIIPITVTQPDGTKKEYTLKIIRLTNPEEDNNLYSIAISSQQNPGTTPDIPITPSFSSLITEYSARVAYNVRDIKIRTIARDMVPQYNEYTLKTGDNKFEIPVVSKNGLTKLYVVNIYREKSSNNAFFQMEIDEYDSKNIKYDKKYVGYSSASPIYKLNVSYDTTLIDVGVSCYEDAQVKATGSTNLKVGENKIDITVTAENGEPKTYTLLVNREKPSTNLESIQINQFYCGTAQTVYNLDVNYSTSKVNIAAVADNDRTATVTGNGQFSLKVGTNKFTVTVKSADGQIKKYPIVVNRLKKSYVKAIVIWVLK